jgi:acylpyruvate hydrolase
VTPDELPKGGAPLRIMTRVNGKVMQDSNTDDLIFDVPTLIHELSKVMTLEPGDVIITGTPSGVAMARKPPNWLKPGDVCEIEIEKIGILRNPIGKGA